MPDDRKIIQDEFERAAAGFAERTAGRFDEMNLLDLVEVSADETMLEVGAGTGNFLQVFEGSVRRRIAVDLTLGMLREARSRHDGLELVQADGARLPFRSDSVDLVASAQMLHHIWEPVPLLMEMRRVAGSGRVLIVDQHATERFEEQAFMNQLEVIRDPSHAVSRAPSAFRVMVQAAGLRIVEEHLWEGRSWLSKWIGAGEFPDDRIAAVRDFIERFGIETGMGWEPDGDDWAFVRRRIVLVCTA